MPSWLTFSDRRQERQWKLTFAAGQAGLDAAVSLQTLLFPSLVARTLWAELGGRHSSTLHPLEAVWLAAFLAWAPLHLLLAQLSPSTYLKLRTPLVLLSRLQRQLTIMRYAALFNQEAMGLTAAAASPGTLPDSLGGILGMLLWRPGSVASLLSTYALPLQYTAPCALGLLGATLHSTLRQCAAECRGGTQVQLYAGILQRLREWLAVWRMAPSSGSSGGGSGTCPLTGLDPLPGMLVGTHSAGGCMGTCVAVHAWLQVVLGALLPLLVLWALEERSRLHFQQQWLQHHAPIEQAGGGTGGQGGPSGSTAVLPAPPATRPVPRLVLAAWLAACALGLWALLEAALL